MLFRFFISCMPLFWLLSCSFQNTDPDKAEIHTSDLGHFWEAFDKSKPDFKATHFDELYLAKGSKGISGFKKGRIKNGENLASIVREYKNYYGSIRGSMDSIINMEDEIRVCFRNLKEIYPDAVFPPVYFVIGALNSGGTTSGDGIVIGSEMYGLSDKADLSEVYKNNWLQSVLKPVRDIPHMVAHELIHVQQFTTLLALIKSPTLLEKSVKEGSADFLAELISGKHINQYVHEYANNKEKELWNEFKQKMHGKDYSNWLYSSGVNRPNDLGYWMGYKITKSYYDQSADKNGAIKEIVNVSDCIDFLEKSGYGK